MIIKKVKAQLKASQENFFKIKMLSIKKRKIFVYDRDIFIPAAMEKSINENNA